MFSSKKPERWTYEMFEKMFEEMNETVNRLMNSAGDEPMVYGFSMKVGPDGVPHVEQFGNMAPGSCKSGSCGNEKPAYGDQVREPFLSSMIDEKKNELKITAEMPGVEKKDIEIKASENEVTLKAESGERKYNKTVNTPYPVDPDSAKAKYNNGVLEVTLKLKEPARPEGKKVDIE